MEIPKYILQSVCTHYKRIAANAVCDKTDFRTLDAFRLSAKDIRNLEKYLKQK